MEYLITPSQQTLFEQKGYLILRDILSPAETLALKKWAQEVHDLPRTEETPWMPYEEINAAGKRVLCRTENYANHHRGFNELLRGSKMLGILGQLARENMLLFKEKSEHVLMIWGMNLIRAQSTINSLGRVGSRLILTALRIRTSRISNI